MSDTGPARPDAEPAAPGTGSGSGAGDLPDPVREVRSDDDRDLGWGDDLDRAGSGGRDARWYEEQRPPHWE